MGLIRSMSFYDSYLLFRYLELVHPLWHMSHFKIKWIYICLAANVSLSVVFHAAEMLPTTKVLQHFFVKDALPYKRLMKV